MKVSIFIPVLAVMAFLLLIDAFVFRGVVSALDRLPDKLLKAVKWTYWLVPVVIAGWLMYMLSKGEPRHPRFFPQFMLLVGFITLFYFPKLVFAIFQFSHDVIGFGTWLIKKLSGPEIADSAGGISRSKFILQLGLVVSAIPFASVINGVLRGRFSFRVVNQKMKFPNLPEAFNGFRLLQISDAHLGSFIGNEKKIETAVELINEQNVDAIVFTGDMVNNLAAELDTFIEVFGKLKAKHGKFSILGNHDYGTHYRWSSIDEKASNLQLLVEHQKKMGFKLLMNENVVFEREGHKIALLGVENWGTPPFPQYGDLEKAQVGVEDLQFKILLSHDPSHWEEVVRKTSNIDLTLSGHTHGMQFGIKIGGWQWSPVSLRYPRWGGLYQEGKQYLYVNRGFGVIGFPGRIGMDPEITVFEFSKA